MKWVDSDVIKWVAIIDYLAVVAFAIGGASMKSTFNNKTWELDTVSRMVTRSSGIQNGFAVFTIASVIVITLAINTIIYRVGDSKYRIEYHEQLKYATWVALFISAISMIGLGVASLEVDEAIHTNMAGSAFTALYIALFLTTCISERTLEWPYVSWGFLLVGLSSLIALATYALDDREEGEGNPGYYWEYILITALHVVLLSMYRMKESTTCFVTSVVFVHRSLKPEEAHLRIASPVAAKPIFER